MKRIAMAIFALTLCSTAVHAQSSTKSDTLLQRLETAKWRPSSLGSGEALQDLFAQDFMTVEYGTDGTFAGVHRVVDAKKLMEAGGEDALISALNQMTFSLSDWQFQHLSPTVVLVSYEVTSPQFGDTHLWATSIWRRVGNKWQTSFYQASKAR
jgi:hypothetical protein